MLLLPSYNPRPGVTIQIRLKEIDIIGAILNIGAWVSSVMAVSFGGAVYAWQSGQIIGLFACSGVLWILFGIQQALCIHTTESRRLFPIEFLKSHEMCILFAQTSASITCAFIPVYFIPLFFQFVGNESALKAGVRLLPFVFIMVSAVIFNGIIMGKTGYYMPFFLVGGILVVIGGTLMYTINLGSDVGRIYGYSAITALGTGLFSQASFPVAQGKVAPTLIPSAVAFIGCAQIGGIVLALSISNSIFINKATNKISNILPNIPLATVQGAISGAGNSFFQSLPSTTRTAVLEAIVSSISNIYIMVIVAGALAVILSFFMKREKLFLAPGTNRAEIELGSTLELKPEEQA